MQQARPGQLSPDMKPQDERYTNGDEVAGSPGGSGSGGGSGGGSGSGSEDEADAEAEELSLQDGGAPARALAALNALRKSRQHYDVVLQAGGAEVAAHAAVLGAASPLLLEALAPAPREPHLLAGVEGDALRALVEYAYTGSLRVPDRGAARRLYLAAWRLRLEPVRAHLAERLLRRLAVRDALAVRALPGLREPQLRALDRYIADRFEEVCSCGALAALPQVRVEVLRASSAAGGAEDPLTVAHAVLAWLRDLPASASAPSAGDDRFSELCSRPHLVYVDARGALRDCSELPSAADEASELREYRCAAEERRARGAAAGQTAGQAAGATPTDAECAVLAARRTADGGTRALLALHGALVAARAGWAAGAAPAGGTLSGAARPARLAAGRCALGAAALGSRLLACGGYDRARVLRSVESYDPQRNAWSPAPSMRRERARFPTAVLGDTLYVIGGSDGHSELESVDALELARGAWAGRARLPLALSHAAAAADPAHGALYVAGGWAAGAYLRRVWRYEPGADRWSEAPSLAAARAQCAGVCWQGALWVLGGCDAWHCLAGAERLPLPAGAGASWLAGPALPTARRSMGACEWRGRLVAAGGSDGAASLRRTDWLEAGWQGAGGWAAGPALRRARAGAGLAVLADTLYAVGGFDGKEFLSCAECLSGPDGEWTALCADSRPAPPLAAAPPIAAAPPPGDKAATEVASEKIINILDEKASKNRNSDEAVEASESATSQ